MEGPQRLSEMSSEEIEELIGYSQRDYEDRIQDLMDKRRRRLVDLQGALNEARERERREHIERDTTTP